MLFSCLTITEQKRNRAEKLAENIIVVHAWSLEASVIDITAA